MCLDIYVTFMSSHFIATQNLSIYDRDVFSTLSNSFDGTFWQKYLTASFSMADSNLRRDEPRF